MTDAANKWIDRNMGRVTLICVLGTCVCFAGIAYLQVRVTGQANEGSKARQRQQAVMPVSTLLYEDAYRRGVITAAELACFRSVANCPAP